MSSIFHDENGDAQNATNQRISKLETMQANVRGQLQRQQRSVLGTIQPKMMAAGGHKFPPPFPKPGTQGRAYLGKGKMQVYYDKEKSVAPTRLSVDPVCIPRASFKQDQENIQPNLSKDKLTHFQKGTKKEMTRVPFQPLAPLKEAQQGLTRVPLQPVGRTSHAREVLPSDKSSESVKSVVQVFQDEISRISHLRDDSLRADSPMQWDSSIVLPTSILKTVEDVDLVRYRPKHNYIRKQPDITSQMRSILVEWLVEVAEEYNLELETLYLTISYLDRFLSVMSVLRGKLQLVGVTAMFIAAKYEEIYPPEISEFTYITDDTYTKEQVLKMEHLMLRVLEFNMCAPTPLVFFSKFVSDANANESTIRLGLFMLELALIETETLKYLPSELASAAFYLTFEIKDVFLCEKKFQEVTSYTVQALRDPIAHLQHILSLSFKHPQMQVIRNKYSLPKYFHVASLIKEEKTDSPMKIGAE
ncbi:unnamed protein product [Darwinula stevensoni]|uniref:Cyclin A n=1 Tax=Darwinula stevensoni TaxID=69355 RepID=A0A7R8XEL0_9CRUS|nr:unnamed protein product [Darwinula stevensoni]CAG0887930.1 unnamed protein product [Darwinula stevensoni]